MKITYQWLKEFIPLRLSPEALSEKLTMAGLEVAGINLDPGGEIVLDIDITANRPDCLGIIGIAREVEAILSGSSGSSKGVVLPLSKFKESKEKTADQVKVIIQDKSECQRYVARVIRGVKIKESPLWLQNRLKALGLRPINNVVDVTNYVLMEYGQPLHAFDFDKIKGRKIIVRHARENEEMVTLDEVRHKLDRTILVIADEERPQALAGLMGGKESEVTGASTNILLESAWFEPTVIRRASKKIGLVTPSSYRFERGVDQEAVLSASRRAAGLIQELAGGEVLRGEVDVYPYPFKPAKIYLRLRRIKDILGLEIEKSRIRTILKSLGLKVEKSETDLWRIQIPGFRRDLSLEIDIIEEIARHFGYNRIPAALPEMVIKPGQREFNYQVYEKVRDIISSIGFQEVVNFSFHSLKELEDIRPGPEREEGAPIPLKNPLSEEQAVLRLSLAPGLLATLVLNLNRGEDNIKIFEVGKTFFFKTSNEPEEKYSLGALVLGEARPPHWGGAAPEMDFYGLKGAVELLLERLGVDEVSFEPGAVSYLSPDSSSLILVGDKKVGWLGQVRSNILGLYDIKAKVFLFEICLDDFISSMRKAVHFKELPRFPASFRDISLIVPEGLPSSKLISAIKGSGGEYLESVEVLDLYRGGQIPPGHLSLTYRLSFRLPQRTLTDEEVDNLQSRIISHLTTNFSIQLRV